MSLPVLPRSSAYASPRSPGRSSIPTLSSIRSPLSPGRSRSSIPSLSSISSPLSPRSPGRSPLSPRSPGLSPEVRYVSNDLRNHIHGFIPVEGTTYGARALAIDPAFLINEMVTLGLDPTVIIANERLRQREARRLQRLPAYKLYQLLSNTKEHISIVEGYGGMAIETYSPELSGKLEQLGYKIPFTRTMNNGAAVRTSYRFVVDVPDDVYGQLKEIYENEKGPIHNDVFSGLFQ